MLLLPRAITVFGVLLLTHACYSAHEHSSLTARSFTVSSTSPTASSHTTQLPLDISLETIVSVLLICVGLVLGAEELKPISWRVWAGKVEREKGKPDGARNPFEGLEERAGFMDIRAKRKEFVEWMKEGNQAVKS